jgi:hypothetical protein
MTQLLVSLDVLPIGAREIVDLCDEAHVDVQTYRHLSDPGKPFSTLRNIIVRGRRYDDKGAACSCAKLRLFAFGDMAYTVCAEHGLQDIGDLHRDLTNPDTARARAGLVRKSSKAVTR